MADCDGTVQIFDISRMNSRINYLSSNAQQVADHDESSLSLTNPQVLPESISTSSTEEANIQAVQIEGSQMCEEASCEEINTELLVDDDEVETYQQEQKVASDQFPHDIEGDPAYERAPDVDIAELLANNEDVQTYKRVPSVNLFQLLQSDPNYEQECNDDLFHPN